MSAILTHIDDPRDKLERATRDEIYDFAKACGVKEITEDMPKPLAIKILRARGLTKINIPTRPLGAGPGVVVDDVPVKTTEIDATDELERQWLAQKTDVSKMSIQDLRSECKRRGIKLDRTDNIAKLKAKLDDQSAA